MFFVKYLAKIFSRRRALIASMLFMSAAMCLAALEDTKSSESSKNVGGNKDICIFIDISGSMSSVLPAVQKYLTDEVIDKADAGTRVDIFKFYGKLVSIFGGNINSAETRDYAKQRVNALLANGPWTNLDNIWDYIKAHGITKDNTALYICSDGHEEVENGVKEYAVTQDDIGKYIGEAQAVDMGGWFLLVWGVPTEQNIPAIQEAQEVPLLPAVQEEQIPAQEAEERSIKRKLSIVLFVILLVIAIAMFICAIASRRAYEQAIKVSIPLEQLNKIEKRCARFIKADVPFVILGIAFFMAGSLYAEVFVVSLALLLCSAGALLLSIVLSTVAVLSTIRKSTEIRQTLKNLMKEAERYDTDASKDLKDEDAQAMEVAHDKEASHRQLVLGLVFGTANIATSTLTTNEFKSFHIRTGTTSAGQTRDAFGEHADTIKVLQKTYYDKLMTEGNEGKIKVTTSLIAEYGLDAGNIKAKIAFVLGDADKGTSA